MKIYPFKLAIAALFLISVLASCEYEYIEVAGPNPNETVSFKTQIEPIFQKDGCTKCHFSGNNPLVLTQGESYNSIIDNGVANPDNPDESKLYTFPDPNGSSSHTTKYQSVSDAQLIHLWIQQGALDN